MVAKTLTVWTLLAFFFTICLSTTIEGAWQLQENSLFQEIDPRTYIEFNFQKYVASGEIKSTLTITGCTKISYEYKVIENEIYFSFVEFGAIQRPCQTDQPSEIRRLMDKVAYTATIGNNLILLSPSGKIIFKMQRVSNKRLLTTVSGAYDAFEVNGKPASVYLQANSSQLQACDGNAVVEYTLPKKNQIRFSIMKVKGCGENTFLSQVYRTKYVREHGPRQLYFYDTLFNIVMKWNKLAYIGWTEELFPSLAPSIAPRPPTTSNPPRVSIPQPQANSPPPPKEGPKQNTPVVTPPKIQQQTQTNKPQISTPKPEPEQPPKQIIATPPPPPQPQPQPQANKPNLPPPKPTTQTPPLTQTLKLVSLPTPPKLQPSQPQIKAEPKIQEKNSSPKEEKAQENFVIPALQSDITTKWFPIKSPINSVGQYSMVILNNRILITACSTVYTMIKFQGGEDGKMHLTGISPKSIDKTCSLKDKPLLDMLSNLSYVTIQKNPTENILTLWNSSNNKIAILSNKSQ